MTFYRHKHKTKSEWCSLVILQRHSSNLLRNKHIKCHVSRHITHKKLSEYSIHYHENFLQYCLCAGTVVTYLKDGFHIDIEIAEKIMSFSYICIQFKVDRPQTTVVAKNLSVLQLFISRMPKMCAILQLVSAPLNPIPIAEHFRRSHPQCEHSCEQHIYMSKENNAKQYEDVM